MKLIILSPVYNDWSCVRQLVPEIDQVFHTQPRFLKYEVEIIFVDDGSTSFDPRLVEKNQTFHSIKKIRFIRLLRNMSNQRALAIGLSFLSEKCSDADAVIVMDSDGEDSPTDIPLLLDCLQEKNFEGIVLARRSRRSEGFMFRLFYRVYKWAFRALTGVRLEHGNFSALPMNYVQSIVLISEIWSHYAAGLMKPRIPRYFVEAVRRPRLEGASKMNFTALVMHGLSGISVFSDAVGVRAIVAIGGIMVMAVIGIFVAAGIKFFTDLAIPNWATTVVLGLSVILFQSLISAFLFAFMILAGRNQATFIPKREYGAFIAEEGVIFSVSES